MNSNMTPDQDRKVSGIARRKTRQVYYGDVAVGGDAPVSVQSMCSLPVTDHDGIRDQISRLASAGCQMVRVSVRDKSETGLLPGICAESPLPVIADIHFDHELAILSSGTGISGLRINPGNIGSIDRVLAVLDAAKKNSLTVRIGVNSGSLEKSHRKTYLQDPSRALCDSALGYSDILEKNGFTEAVFSLKSSDAMATVEANRLFAKENDYPLHIGVTEAGPRLSGTARSVVALTLLLSEGIGDTVRISLSGDPVDEVTVALAMLSSLGLRDDVPRIISCPTCGRCHLDVERIAEALEKAVPRTGHSLKVAVMGCEVNGPGEAKEADIGIAGTEKGAVLFKNGRIFQKISGDPIASILSVIKKMIGEEE